MEASLRHINCRNLTLESADKLTTMSSRIQDTTYFAVFLQPIQGSNPAICFCYFNTEGRLHRTSLAPLEGSNAPNIDTEMAKHSQMAKHSLSEQQIERILNFSTDLHTSKIILPLQLNPTLSQSNQ